ncbi:MAG: hypothetical protein ACOY3E_17445 [Pseudomonadota bacterium]
MIRRWRFAAVVTLLGISGLAVAAQQAETVTATELKSKPDAKAGVVAKLGKGSALLVHERQGGWYAAEHASGKGWIRLLHVRLAGNAGIDGKGSAGALMKLGSISRTDTTVATGIRGLTAEELAKARENPQELAKLAQFDASEQEARTFAKSGGVNSRNDVED